MSAANPNPNPLCDANTRLVQRPQDLSGNQLPESPKTKIALNATYSWDLARGVLSPSVSYIWRDKQYSTLFTRPLDAAPSWDQWDARVTWTARDNRYSIIAFVKNIGDTLGYDGGASASRNHRVLRPVDAHGRGPDQGPPNDFAACNTATQNCIFNAVQGFEASYTLTPPRTYGVEFQYRF